MHINLIRRPQSACKQAIAGPAIHFALLLLIAISASVSFAEEPASARFRSDVPWAYESGDGDSIVAVQENGRTVYVNGPKRRNSSRPRETARREHSLLVYWNNKERRWKPVPPPSPSALRAARSAAAEVSSFIQAQPAIASTAQLSAASAFEADAVGPKQAGLALSNPNYRRIARGHAVTAAEVDAVIEAAAVRHRVDPNLVRAIVKVESNFNPHAVSRAGAMGLMQLMPDTARSLNVVDPFDPQQNVDAGVRHLRNLLDNFGGDLKLSLAAYNAGETAVARSNGIPRNSETQNYVKQITSMYWNDGPIASARNFYRRGADPIRVFRGNNGVLTFSNTE